MMLLRTGVVLGLFLAIDLIAQRATRWFLSGFAETAEDPLIYRCLLLVIAGGSLAAALYITRRWRK